MKMSNSAPRHHHTAWLVLVLVLVAGLLAAQVWLWGSVFDAASTFRDRQTQQQQLENVRELVARIRSADSSQQTLVEQATVAFPGSGTVPHVVERVEALAQSHGLMLELRSIGEQSLPRAVLHPLDLSLMLTGSPQALLTFLDNVEHMQEFTQVEEWAMKPVPSDQVGGKVYTVTMKLRFFLQPESSDG